jgi:2,7-dihydroxy-5-methyl-1-naphthoate 7-O-methyltransferase
MSEVQVSTPAETESGPGPAALDPFSRLNELADPVAPWAVRTVATLRVPDLIAKGHVDLVDLADHTGLKAERLERLMRYLTHRGVFAVTGQGRYGLTPMSMLLCEGAPGGLRDYLDLDGAVCRLDRVSANLLDALRDDEAAYRKVYGREAWEDLAANPTLAATFDTAMSHKSRLMAPAIAACYGWGSAKHVVDVGGGNGVILAEILKAHPGLQGTLFDRPGTSDAGTFVLEEAGVADRATTVAGDFFAGVPRGGDVYLMVNVLHDWNDPEAQAILGRCAEAAGPDGKVVIAEFIVDGGGDQATVTRWDLLMLLGATGRERTRAEYAALAEKVGLRIASVTPTPTGLNLIECVAAGRT